MTTAMQTTDGAALVEKVVIEGDLSKLSPAERLLYYRQVCESLGLNPLTKPFDYITLSGKMVLYAKRDATDQLRKLHKISVTIASREIANAFAGDVYVVTARATTPEGRTDESIGAVTLTGLKGDALANALMKAETKAKRRVTLSICGLGLLDETEVETIPDRVEPRPEGSTTSAVPGDSPTLPAPAGAMAHSTSRGAGETPAPALSERDSLLLQISALGAVRYGKGWRESVKLLANSIIERPFKLVQDLSVEELQTLLDELEQTPVAS